jgi:hypothetical protein
MIHLIPSVRPGRIANLVGQRFDFLVVIRFAGMCHHMTSQDKPVWVCQCDCGQECLRQSQSLRNPRKRSSCGCQGKHRGTDPEIRQKFSKEYIIWQAIWYRCTNPNAQYYNAYGGRGITVDPRWRSFKTFMTDMGGRPGPNYSIERMKNNLGYSQENCRWATQAEQMRNTRRNHWVTYQHVTQCLADWSKETGIPRGTLVYRLKSRWHYDLVFSPLRFSSERWPIGL